MLLLRACRNRETTLLKKAGWPVRGWLRMAEDGFTLISGIRQEFRKL